MELKQTKEKAEKLIEQYCPEYKFQFDNAKVRFGYCSYRKKVISLSKHLVMMNSEEQVVDTILHEIAHAIVGRGHGHDHVWRAKAIEIGCNGERCYNSEDVEAPKGRFTYVCPNCDKEVNYHRRLKRSRACGECCKAHNYGRYTDKFKFRPKGFIEQKPHFTLKRWDK